MANFQLLQKIHSVKFMLENIVFLTIYRRNFRFPPFLKLKNQFIYPEFSPPFFATEPSVVSFR